MAEEIKNIVSDLSKRQTESERVISNITIKMDTLIDSKYSEEETLRNIDNNVNEIKLKLAGEQLERNREIKITVDPLWDTIRTTNANIEKNKLEAEKNKSVVITTVKTDLRREVKAHVIVIWAFIMIIGSLSLYIINNISDDVEELENINIVTLKEISDQVKEQVSLMNNTRKKIN